MAFVSFIRAYKEHQANFIFDLAQLDVGALANQFGLPVLPKMPELKSLNVSNFQKLDIELDQIKYLNKDKEVKRGKEKVKAVKVKKEAWSANKEKQKRKQKRRETKMKKVLAKESANSEQSQ
jgi:ATP-dependent RNA helicase DDX55/SPB4